MTILFLLFCIIAGIVALLLIVAFFLKREHYVERGIVIDAPREKVFEYLRLIENQETFNNGAMADADRKKEFKGTDGTVGYIYSWSGDKDAGVGEKEIINIIEGKQIEMEIRFVKPMKTSAKIIMETDSLPGGETRVSWSNAGMLKYPLNLMISMVEKHVVKDLEISLATLKRVIEG